MKNTGFLAAKLRQTAWLREKLDMCRLHKKHLKKWIKKHRMLVKIQKNGLAVHTGVQGGVQNDKRRRGYCAGCTAAGEVKRWLLLF